MDNSVFTPMEKEQLSKEVQSMRARGMDENHIALYVAGHERKKREEAGNFMARILGISPANAAESGGAPLPPERSNLGLLAPVGETHAPEGVPELPVDASKQGGYGITHFSDGMERDQKVLLFGNAIFGGLYPWAKAYMDTKVYDSAPGADFDTVRRYAQDFLKNAEEAQPQTARAANVWGAILGPMTGLGAAKISKPLSNVKAATAGGILHGSVRGYTGPTEPDSFSADRLPSALLGATTGAVTGAVAGKIADKIGAYKAGAPARNFDKTAASVQRDKHMASRARALEQNPAPGNKTANDEYQFDPDSTIAHYISLGYNINQISKELGVSKLAVARKVRTALDDVIKPGSRNDSAINSLVREIKTIFKQHEMGVKAQERLFRHKPVFDPDQGKVRDLVEGKYSYKKRVK